MKVEFSIEMSQEEVVDLLYEHILEATGASAKEGFTKDIQSWDFELSNADGSWTKVTQAIRFKARV